jgi:hypothetical protein
MLFAVSPLALQYRENSKAHHLLDLLQKSSMRVDFANGSIAAQNEKNIFERCCDIHCTMRIWRAGKSLSPIHRLLSSATSDSAYDFSCGACAKNVILFSRLYFAAASLTSFSEASSENLAKPS